MNLYNTVMQKKFRRHKIVGNNKSTGISPVLSRSGKLVFHLKGVRMNMNSDIRDSEKGV